MSLIQQIPPAPAQLEPIRKETYIEIDAHTKTMQRMYMSQEGTDVEPKTNSPQTHQIICTDVSFHPNKMTPISGQKLLRFLNICIRTYLLNKTENASTLKDSNKSFATSSQPNVFHLALSKKISSYCFKFMLSVVTEITRVSKRLDYFHVSVFLACQGPHDLCSVWFGRLYTTIIGSNTHCLQKKIIFSPWNQFSFQRTQSLDLGINC